MKPFVDCQLFPSLKMNGLIDYRRLGACVPPLLLNVSKSLCQNGKRRME